MKTYKQSIHKYVKFQLIIFLENKKEVCLVVKPP